MDGYTHGYNMKSSVLSGEGCKVSSDVLNDWVQRIPSLCTGYTMVNIFKTHLFFQSLPNRHSKSNATMCTRLFEYTISFSKYLRK